MQGGLAEGGDSRDPCIRSLLHLEGSGWAKIPHTHTPNVLLEESFLKQDQAGNGRGGGGRQGVRVRARCR